MTDNNAVTIRDSVIEARDRLVHFLSKATNSNAPSVKIRVGRNAGLNLPYISVRCLIQKGAMVLFTAENQKTQSKLHGFSSVMIKNANGEDWQKTQNEKAPPIVLSNVERQFLLSIHDETQSFVDDCGVDMRLRQVLLPYGNDGYLGIVPLQSMPLMRMTQKTAQKMVQSDAQKNVYRRLPEIDYPAGGGKSQNAGLETGYRKFVVTGFYRRNAMSSQKMSALHSGVTRRLQMDIETLKSYKQFIANCNWSTYEQKAHRGYVRRIVEHYLRQSAQIAENLSDDNIDSIESDFEKGLLDVSLRGPSWRLDFADWIFRRMHSEVVGYHDGQPLYLSGVNRNYLRNIIREVVF